MHEKAEEIRLRYLYRELVLRRKIWLPLEAAVKLVGPDCAYHLYSIQDFKDTSTTHQARTTEEPQ
ncbi:MAG: hypothetical protein ABSA46_19685 [Thermodesulfovibrionales bacterium]